MSRTYRGKDRVRLKGMGHTSSRNSKGQRPPMYRNASRLFCVSYGASKWLFKSENAAKAAISYNKKVAKRHGEEAKYERAYFCKNCGGWHITTTTKAEFTERIGEFAKQHKLGKIEYDTSRIKHKKVR